VSNALTLEDLKPAPYNPREISPLALEGLQYSLVEFGDISGIVWNRKTGHLVCGHQRLNALRQEYGDGLTMEDHTIVTPRGERFAVREVDWDDMQERLANLAANNPLIAGLFTPSARTMIEELKGLAPIQVEALQLGELLETLPMAEVEGATDPDFVPEAPEEPVTKPGDVWLLGEHRLMCGDCREQKIEWPIVTDPPYGVGYVDEAWDSQDVDEHEALFAWLNAQAVPIVYFCGTCNLLREMQRGPCKVAIWHKPWSMTHSGIGNGRHHWEPVIMRGLLKGAYLPSDVLVLGTDRVPGLRDGHSCPKPIELIRQLADALLPGPIICDPFCGSGTTIIAAEQLGRRCYAMEIEPRYCDVAVRRWEAFTERKAELEGDI